MAAHAIGTRPATGAANMGPRRGTQWADGQRGLVPSYRELPGVGSTPSDTLAICWLVEHARTQGTPHGAALVVDR